MKLQLLLLAVCVCSAFATGFQDCGSKGTNVKLTVPECDMPPCTLKRGSSFTMSVSFKTDNSTIKDLKSTATARIAGQDIGWPGFSHKGCKHLTTGSCPIPPHTDVTWQYKVKVLSLYPRISTVATFKFKSGEDVQACLQVPVKLV